VKNLLATRKVIEDPERVSGKNFTFGCFLDFLVKTSTQAFKKDMEAESLALLLEKMDVSDALASLGVRTYTSHTTLLPAKKIVKKMQ
jgi:hypothetical protein